MHCAGPARPTTGVHGGAVAHARTRRSGAAHFPLREGRECRQHQRARARPSKPPYGRWRWAKP
eukprot:3763266-Alexandrium_andersonii.AAC.1